MSGGALMALVPILSDAQAEAAAQGGLPAVGAMAMQRNAPARALHDEADEVLFA